MTRHLAVVPDPPDEGPPRKRTYRPYGKCRANCGLGLDLALVDDPATNSGIHPRCEQAVEAASVAREAVKRRRRRKAT